MTWNDHMNSLNNAPCVHRTNWADSLYFPFYIFSNRQHSALLRRNSTKSYISYQSLLPQGLLQTLLFNTHLWPPQEQTIIPKSNIYTGTQTQGSLGSVTSVRAITSPKEFSSERHSSVAPSYRTTSTTVSATRTRTVFWNCGLCCQINFSLARFY
jgi:hypothetical protein